MNTNNLIGISPHLTLGNNSARGVENMFGSTFTGTLSAQDVLNYNARQAELERQENRYLSDTAYSRAFKDLKSVGINPYAFASAPQAPVISAPTARASVGATSNTANLRNLVSTGLALASLLSKFL